MHYMHQQWADCPKGAFTKGFQVYTVDIYTGKEGTAAPK
jgi:hypothetical protein